MKSNKVINSARVVNKVVLWLCYTFFGLLTFLVIHWHINPGAYNQLDVTSAFKAGYGINDFNWKMGEFKPLENSLYMSQLPALMVYWIYLRAVLFFSLTFLIIREVEQILKSIASLKTFYDRNEYHLRKIAQWAFIAFLLSCFNFSYLNGNFQLDFKLVFAPLLLSVGSLVLAEIFSEGKELSEDQRMIV